MKSVLYLLVSLGFGAAIDSDWKPIIGSGPSLKHIHRPILLNSVLNTASSSKSTITFNGQTITTNIGDDGLNDAAGSVLAIDAPDLSSSFVEEPRYLGYGTGKIVNGLFGGSASVSGLG